jgi:hypothetical protein
MGVYELVLYVVRDHKGVTLAVRSTTRSISTDLIVAKALAALYAVELVGRLVYRI